MNYLNAKLQRKIWLGLALCAAPLWLQAQDLSRVLPEEVPQLVQPLNPVEMGSMPFAVDLGAGEGESVILPRLQGIILLPGEDMLNRVSPAAVGSSGLYLDAFPVMQNAGFEQIANSFVGRPVSAESIRRLQQVVRIYLGQIGLPFSLVYFPEQDITEGYLQLVVLQSQFEGEIQVEGNRYFDDQRYTRWIRQQPGQPIDQLQLDADVAWINRNPFRAASIVASAGEQPGTTRLLVQARELQPWRFFLGANNNGSQSTTEERVLAGFNWGNAFGLGHQMTLQVTSDPEFDHSRAVSGSYSLDLPWRHSLSLSGAYSETDGIVATPFSLTGRSWQVGASYALDLQPRPASDWRSSLVYGFDFKSSDNNFDFADIPVTDNLTEVVQLRAQFSTSKSDPSGATAIALSLTAAPGGLTDRNDDAFFTVSRALASANYLYGSLSLNRRSLLSDAWQGWEWRANARLQLSSHNLIGSEQMGAGGSASVRGYEEGEVYGDEGLLFSQELVAPAFSLAEKLGWQAADSASLFVFQDYAQTRSVNPLPGESNFELASLGVGLRYHWAQAASLQAAWGKQLMDSGSSDSGDNSRLHLSLQLNF